MLVELVLQQQQGLVNMHLGLPQDLLRIGIEDALQTLI